MPDIVRVKCFHRYVHGNMGRMVQTLGNLLGFGIRAYLEKREINKTNKV
jgi:hypothetical protein